MKLDGPVDQVARTLLGSILRAGSVAVRVTEVEAYGGPDDPGSHAFRGITPRNQVMFGPAGRAYVYFSYGMHWCLNVVTGREGDPAAVLLRAGAVVDGAELVRSRRPGVADRDLCRGPARLTRALAVDGAFTGTDLLLSDGWLRLEAGHHPVPTVLTGPRVGVSGAGAATPWRFWLPDEPSVSAYRGAAARKRSTDGAPSSP